MGSIVISTCSWFKVKVYVYHVLCAKFFNVSFVLGDIGLRLSYCGADAETFQVVSAVIAEQLAIDVNDVRAESKFTDLGADSLDTVEIMMALEEKFDIQLDEDNAEQIVTVQHAADLIQDVVTAKKA
ncbi:unnamed protein product [Sphagnum jensenii]|uniref:Acyl carrier protein n=1 Tax=Sphagnum jensenii TaxID=128206 RepID=A0ABP0WNJ4_9BRYO